MKIDQTHRLVIEAGENFNYRFIASPNESPKAQLEERVLVIHAPGSRTVNGAISPYLTKPKNFLEGKSKHLVIGSDGVELVQLLPFNRGALHAFGYNGRSIAIELQYPGQLVQQAPSFNKTKKLRDDQFILASSINSSHYGEWALYPKEQLDALLKIALLLLKEYKITDVVGYDEISNLTHPGPAFPMIQFRETLLGITDHRSFILQEMARKVPLLGQPGNPNSLLSPTSIPVGTPVSVINEKGDWYLISVIANVDGNPWRTGWVTKNAVRVKTDFVLRVRPDHYLVDQQGRRFQEITPHQNGYQVARKNDQPKYIVMHFTTGTKMESTISHFKNPASLVSTHLLIGRDGRVIQFLPFDRIAHHCGYSWWERQANLNNFSIGIELDNAGLLTRTRNGWSARKIAIPDELVEQAVHWKQLIPKDPNRFYGWEKFPEAQLRVALGVVKALKARYPSIVEILGHDDINIINRYDPGPLFPMPKFRMELFGRREPEIEIFTINKKTDLYSNHEGRLPNPKQSAHAEPLPAQSTVRVIREESDMALVTVITSKANNLRQVTGWVRKSLLTERKDAVARRGKEKDKEKSAQRITSRAQTFFRRSRDGHAPTTTLPEGPFEAGTRVRIQQIRNQWTLVVVLDETRGRKGMEGWLPTELLSPEVVI